MTDLPDMPRLVLHDIEAMPRDGAAQRAARSDLSARDYGVWLILREQLWERGSLPLGWAALAKIAGIGVPSFERAAPKLDRHFDRTREGAWTDDVLMQARGARPVVPSPEAPALRTAARPERSSINADNARRGWEKRRARDRDAGAGDTNASAGDASEDANNGATECGSQAATGDVASDFAVQSASLPRAPGLLVGSKSVDFNEQNRPTNRGRDTRRDANSHARTDANGAAIADAEDARRIEAILGTCPGKILPATAVWGLRNIKPWLTDSCDFDADFLPSLRAFGMTNSDVRNIANPIIQEATFFARDRRLATRTLPGAAARAIPDVASMTPFGRALHLALRHQDQPAAYISWYTLLIGRDVADGIARLEVPTKFLRQKMDEREATVLAAARAADPSVRRLDIRAQQPAAVEVDEPQQATGA